MPDIVSLNVEDGIAVVAVNNPPVNTINAAVRAGLSAALDRIAREKGLKGLLLVCDGSTFFSGADIGEFAGPPKEEEYRVLFNRFEALPFPAAAAMHGTVMGGGLEIALACHYRAAAPGTRLGLPEVTLGIIPGAGGTQRLPRLIGRARAKELILTARRIGADEAYRIGLVNAVAPAGELMPAALELAHSIARNGPVAVRAAKRAIDEGGELPLVDGLAVEARCYETTLPTEDRLEALAAFAEKRAPRYRGV